MTFEATIAKSVELDRALARPLGEVRMPEIGGKKLSDDIGGMLADVRKTIDEAKIGLAGAVTELTEEVNGLKHVETAIRGEAKAVRDMKASILGNATGGENEEPKA